MGEQVSGMPSGENFVAPTGVVEQTPATAGNANYDKSLDLLMGRTDEAGSVQDAATSPASTSAFTENMRATPLTTYETQNIANAQANPEDFTKSPNPKIRP